MSKANQKFVQADEAVSPVIGVILMVAITVVLAAVVFVLVSNLSKTSDKSEEAATTSRSPSAGILEITLVKGGDHAPYQFHDADAPDYATISVNGVECNFGDPAATPAVADDPGLTYPSEWSAGGVVRINGDPGGADSDTTTATDNPQANGCALEVESGESVSVNISVAGTLIQSTTVDIRN